MIKPIKSWKEYYFFIQKNYSHPLLVLLALPLSIFSWLSKQDTKQGYYLNQSLLGLIVYNKRRRLITYLLVLPSVRRQGIASQLISESQCDLVVSLKKSELFWNRMGYNREIQQGICYKILMEENKNEITTNE